MKCYCKLHNVHNKVMISITRWDGKLKLKCFWVLNDIGTGLHVSCLPLCTMCIYYCYFAKFPFNLHSCELHYQATYLINIYWQLPRPVSNDTLCSLHVPVGQLKQLHSIRSCPVTDLAFRSCYCNIPLLKFTIVQ